MSTPDRGHSPIPGENRLALVATAVMLAVSGVALVAVGITALFADGLGPTLVGLVVLVVVALLGFGVSLVQRREYLRKVRNGDVIVREPWSGADLLPPG